jgi:hypothetical protein
MTQTGKLGTADSQLGNMPPAFACLDDALPSTGMMSGKLGISASMLGNVLFALSGPDSPKVIHLWTQSLLLLTHSAVCEAEFVPHASPAWALGGFDSRLGNNLLAFTGADAPGPLTGSITGRLGTANSTLGNMRPALGNEEGESDAGIINVSADSVLSLTQSARYQAVFARNASCALSLDHTVLLTTMLTASADNTLALEYEAVGMLGGIHILSAENTLDLEQAVGAAVVLNLSAQSTLTLIQNAIGANGREYELDAESVLDIEQDCTAFHTFNVAAETPLLLFQGVAVSRPWHLSAESVLQETHWEFSPATLGLVEVIVGLNDSAELARPLSLEAGNVVPLMQTASAVCVKPTAINLSAENIIALIDGVDKNQAASASTWLAFSQTAAIDTCKPLESELELTSEAAASIVRKCSAASALTLTQSVTFTIVKGDIQYQYHPFIGEGSPNAPAPPPATLAGPLEGITTPFQLLYPATGDATDYVTLRAPDFGNKDRLSFNRVLRETRGGTLIVYADPIWPKIQTLVLNFSGLPTVKARQLLDFLDGHLGEEVGLMDWEHRYWRGVVTTPDDPVVQDGPDSFSASFEFEGELVPA